MAAQLGSLIGRRRSSQWWRRACRRSRSAIVGTAAPQPPRRRPPPLRRSGRHWPPHQPPERPPLQIWLGDEVAARSWCGRHPPPPAASPASPGQLTDHGRYLLSGQKLPPGELLFYYSGGNVNIQRPSGPEYQLRQGRLRGHKLLDSARSLMPIMHFRIIGKSQGSTRRRLNRMVGWVHR